MSEDDFEYEYDPIDGYEPEPEQNDQDDFELENMFYEADDTKNSNPAEAIETFTNIISMEEAKGENKKWKYKCLQNIIYCSCKLNRGHNIQRSIEQIIKLMDTVSKNEANDTLLLIIDSVGTLQDPKLVEENLNFILRFLEEKNYEQLWLNTSLKISKNYLERFEKEKLSELLQKIKMKCRNPDGTDDQKKSSLLLEVYSIDIQACIQSKNYQGLKEISKRTKNLSSAIFDPKSMAVIRESSGKLLMIERNWKEATSELLEAFKYYQDVGSSQAKTVLKYFTLASILSHSEINVFYSREAKVFKDDPEILAMQELRNAYENKDITRFNRVLNDKTVNIATDEFIKNFIEDLVKIISLEKIKSIIVPYSRIRIGYLARELNTTETLVLHYLQELLVEEKINGKIDHVAGFYENYNFKIDDSERLKTEALSNWVRLIKGI